MKTRALLVPVLALLLVNCSDGKRESNSTTADTTAATTAETTAQTTAETTAETTAPDPVAERIAAAQEIEGTYTGQLNDTTSGATAPINATFAVNAATAIATVTVTFGDDVVDASEEGLFLQFDLNKEGPYSGTNELLGDFTIDYVDGHLILTAPAIPGFDGGPLPLSLEGDFSAGSFTGTYVIEGLAEGTFEATRA